MNTIQDINLYSNHIQNSHNADIIDQKINELKILKQEYDELRKEYDALLASKTYKCFSGLFTRFWKSI